MGVASAFRFEPMIFVATEALPLEEKLGAKLWKKYFFIPVSASDIFCHFLKRLSQTDLFCQSREGFIKHKWWEMSNLQTPTPDDIFSGKAGFFQRLNFVIFPANVRIKPFVTFNTLLSPIIDNYNFTWNHGNDVDRSVSIIQEKLRLRQSEWVTPFYPPSVPASMSFLTTPLSTNARIISSQNGAYRFPLSNLRSNPFPILLLLQT